MSEEVKSSCKTALSTGSSCRQTPSKGRHLYPQGFPGGSDGKESACSAEDPVWSLRKILWRRERQPSPVFLPGESHGQRSLAGYSPWDHKESNTIEWLIVWSNYSYEFRLNSSLTLSSHCSKPLVVHSTCYSRQLFQFALHSCPLCFGSKSLVFAKLMCTGPQLG